MMANALTLPWLEHMSNIGTDGVPTLLCGRCNYDEADPDEPLPTRFIYHGAVCHACSHKLVALDHQLTDREEWRWAP